MALRASQAGGLPDLLGESLGGAAPRMSQRPSGLRSSVVVDPSGRFPSVRRSRLKKKKDASAKPWTVFMDPPADAPAPSPSREACALVISVRIIESGS